MLSIEELLSVAMSLPPDRRGSYLEGNCADPAVRAEVLRRLSDATQTLPAREREQHHHQRGQAPAIRAGTRLGHYRIQGALGAGGMGYVYEALDEGLNRPVAIKVLPVGRYDEASRARFRREAEAASALNHPNIVTVHEVGREGEIDFIAMERIAGQTLHSLAGGRPMPIKRAIQILTQVADALAAAHEAGIVHRDLKPSNVMVSERGLAKVLDFGLAKQVVSAAAARAEAEEELSRTGQIVGTVHYMSPEQAEGKAVDARSDVFAFGTMLYELVTGKRPFQRETPLATLAAIINTEPEPLRSLRPDAPKLLESVFAKCTRKQPFERWQSLSDVKLILEDLAADPDLTEGPAAGRRAGWIWLAAAGALALGVAGTLGIERLRRPAAGTAASTPGVLRMVTAEQGLSTTPALSPDGSLLAFASDRANDGNLDIWIQQVGGGEPMRLTSDPADESAPSFSPDGSRIAFRSEKDGGGIYVVPALRGDAVLLAPKGRNPRFSPDGKSIAYWEGREGSMAPGASRAVVADLGGGAPRAIETGLAWTQYPVWSPDGTSLVLYGMTGATPSRSAVDWWIVPAAGGKAKAVRIRESLPAASTRVLPTVLDWFTAADGRQHAVFAPDGGDNANLWRIGLAADGRVSGPPVRMTIGPGWQAAASSRMGKEGVTRLAYADETVNYDVWRQAVNAGSGLAEGPLEAITTRLTPEMNPSISGDDGQAYFITLRLGTWSIVRKELGKEGNRERVLYSLPEFLYNARVATRGPRLFFSKRPYELMALPADGGVVEKVCSGCGSLTGVSATGDRVLLEPAEEEHLMMYDVASQKLVKLADRGGPDTMLSGGQFSPDGQWVAFGATNNRTGGSSIFAIPTAGPLPVPREQWIAITSESEISRDPLFAPSGQFLYFTAEKDGFRCLWARRINPATRVPVGEAFPVRHFHTARLALRNRASSGNIIGLNAGGRYLVFALTGTTGNIWLEETRRAQ